jgi:glutathione peroxidase
MMWNTVIGLAGLAAVIGMATLPAPEADAAAPKTGVLSYTMKNIDGKQVPLSKYKGKVLLIVNTASLCGNTPQYASLEKLHEQYGKQGLRILAFPANNFGKQEPGTDKEIKFFCTSKYNTKFDIFSKISVKGEDQAPLYRYLTNKKTNPQFGGDIEWNFAKFLVNRNGEVVARFPAGHDPLSPDVVAAVKEAMKPAKKG